MHRWFRKCAGQTTFRRTGDAARLRFEQLEDRRLLTVASFQDGVFPTVDYDGTRDAPIFGAQADVNFGGDDIIRADSEQSSTGFPVWSLMKWDLSSIPAGATLNDVMLTVNVTNTTAAPGFDLFQVLTPWEESGVTWNNTTAVATWEEPGAMDPEDLDPTVLGTLLGTTTGGLTIALGTDGEDVVQQWISNPATNHGLMMANPANDNSLRFDSREGITPANRPMLSVDFTFEDLDPPIATLVDPLDGGPADEDADDDEVRVGVREVIVIGLDDYQLDDATVTANTVTIEKDAVPFTDYTFAFDAATDQIALTPMAGSFGEGVYTVTLSGGVSQIADQSGNIMPGVELLVEIDASLPTTPVAEDDDYDTDEGVPLVVNAIDGVLANDFDGNTDADTIIVTGPGNGNVGLSLDGSFIYTPGAGFSGQDTFTYRIRTPLFDSSVATVTISVFGQAPVAGADTYDTTEDELLTVDEAAGVLANDDDLQDEAITAVLVDGVSDGTLVLDPTGSFAYQPDENFFGTDSFTYYATDGVNNSASTLVEITVDGVNDAPVAVDDEFTLSADQSLIYRSLVLNDNPTAYWEFDDSSGSEGATVRDSSGNENDAVYRNGIAFATGPSHIQGNAAHFDGSADWVALTADPFGNYPTSGITSDYHITVESWFRAEPDDRGIILGQTGSGGAPGGSGPNGWAPALFLGNSGQVWSSVFYHGNSLQITSPGTYDDDQWHHVASTYTAGTERLFVDGALVGSQSVNQYAMPSTPVYYLGTGYFTNVWNGLSGNNWNFFRGDLDEVAIYDRALSPDEIHNHYLAGIGQLDELGLSVLANDTDPDGDDFDAELVDDVQEGTLQFSADGTFTYTPNPGFIGNDTFTYRANDGELDSDVATVVIRINGAPVATDDAYEIDEDRILDIDALAGVLENDTGTNEDELTAQLVTPTSHGELTLNSDGSFTYTPDENYFGLDTFYYRAHDGAQPSSNTRVEITVESVNDLPVAANDAYTIHEDEFLTAESAYVNEVLGDEPIGYWRLGETAGSVTAEDAVGNHDGVYENFAADGFSQPGALARDANKSVIFDGVDDRVTIPHSADLAITGDLTVEFWMYKTAEASNYQRLVGKGARDAETFGVYELPGSDKRMLFQQYDGSGNVVANLTSNSVVELDQWHHVVATVESSTVKIYIDGAFDVQGTRSGAVGVDDQPLVIGGKLLDRHDVFPGRLDEVAVYRRALTNDEVQDHYLIGKTGVGSSPLSVLANDVDDDGDVLTAEVVEDVQNGTLNLSANGGFSYVPDSGFDGVDQFTYVANDGQNNSQPATVTITVIPNTPPVAVSDSFRYESGTLQRVDDNYVDTVLADEPMAYWRLGETAGSIAAIDATGNFSGTYQGSVVLGEPGALATDTDTAVEFDGSPSYVDVGDHSEFNQLTNGFTIEAWVKVSDISGSVQRFVDNRSGVTGGFGFGRQGSRLTFTTYGHLNHLTGENALVADEWQYVAVTFDSQNDAHFYVGGELLQVVPGTSPASPSGSPLYLGRSPTNPNGTTWANLEGILDEVAIYDRVLSAEEIRAHFDSDTINVLRNDQDAEGHTISAVLDADAQNGTLSLEDDGAFLYTPDPGFVGVDRFTYVSFDGLNQSVPATVTIDVPPTGPISGRHVFYNNSSLDGQDPAAEAQDDNAIATEKWALLPLQTLSPGKVFAGAQGINGLMIDIDGVGDAANLGPDDFVVRTGTEGDPSGWDVLELVDNERVPGVSVREGDGVGGSDRVTLTWPDGTLTNTYVQVTVLDNGHTGLAEPDVFYVASQVGDATGDRKVNADDLARVLANWGTGTLPEQGNFDLTGTTGAADLAALFVGGGPLDDFTAPPIVAPPDAAQAVDAVIVQAISGPQPETDPIIAPVEIPQASTSPGTRPRLLRRIGRSFSDDAQPTDRHRLARQQAVDRVHEGELLEIDAKLRRARRRR